MSIRIRHDILVSGDREQCARRVRHFFSTTKLVGYDEVVFDKEQSFQATDPLFWLRVDEAVAGNRRAIGDLLDELRDTGCTGLADLATMSQGASSKLLHTIVHLLDGFFGIDSCFFDLDEASHWVSGEKRRKIETAPDKYHLLAVIGISQSDSGVPNLIERHIK